VGGRIGAIIAVVAVVTVVAVVAAVPRRPMEINGKNAAFPHLHGQLKGGQQRQQRR
jgi:hypothetical protein